MSWIVLVYADQSELTDSSHNTAPVWLKAVKDIDLSGEIVVLQPLLRTVQIKEIDGYGGQSWLGIQLVVNLLW